MVNRYSLRDESGHPVESPAEILMRTARVVAEAENNYRSSGATSIEIREKFFEMLYEMRFMPNGRTMANAGTKYGQLANCFVLPVEDDLGKGTDSIFSVLRKAILVLQTGGGVGFSFGRIRPKDASISTTKGKTTGAVSFIKVYDTAFWVIGQGGGRRSAAMAVLPVWHPDILEFVKCKSEEGQITNFNISVGITDEFMKAVKKDDDFTLRHPENGEMYKMIPARELFSAIVDSAYKNGEPGVLFLDTANASNPVPHLYKLEATNPCGEQFLGPYENCCLGSINLREHVKKFSNHKFSNSQMKSQYMVDWDKLAETVQLATRFLDNVVDANKYVTAVPEIEEAARRVRRIGLSVMGLSDLMYMVNVRYGSAKGQELASQIMEFIRYYAMKSSVELAKIRGPFPGIVGSIYDPQNMTWSVPKPLIAHKTNFGRSQLDWKSLIKELKQDGIRNGAQTTIAPTGSIATISGLEGYGCEPVFALSYTRHTREGAEREGKEWREMYYTSELFSKLLIAHGLTKSQRNIVLEKVRKNGGSCQGIDEVPKEIRDVYVVSSDLAASEHVRMQASMQRWIDNSISKTINFPPNARPEEIAAAYQLGWATGLKGMTVYVEGSRQQVVLEKKIGPYETKTEKQVTSEELCPECGTPMRKEEGCSTCPACAYSKCDK
ncbi:ribonucleoside-diphosphate reductase, adenosylcobalamin-dependent [Candidatus Collierbacteria bacterium CG09_land_8_20_14_0_10_46_12]|uniref:Vitamin B12-dependent ribonucleotide reductase n=3 Tax=Candidatus Collieribacteriota TaxID=1752725 RepID=A0A2H0WZQ6_9BACT|nr:MAG: ribonucleoside-diphosphate reductase, adenosylcobalamin-dependent [Candidatus Collierbacteria bacterium CG09_land_8_20_14_0_10_46_12]